MKMMPCRMGLPMYFAMVDREALAARWQERFKNRSLSKPDAVRFEIKADAGDTAEILLYDEIGYWGITATEFVQQLATITAPSVNVRINSPGGDVFDGLAIYAALQAHPADITCTVEGWAASAASFIALSGKKCVMAPNAFMMIHNAWGLAVGNAADHADMAVTLDKIDGQLASIYSAKSGKPVDEIQTLMKGKVDGTWFTADEAMALGLIDEILGSSEDEQAAAEASARAGRISNMRRRLALSAVEV